MGGALSTLGEMKNACKVLVGRPERKKPIGRTGRRWKDNIKMDSREIGFGNVEWIHLTHDRDLWRDLGNTLMNFRIP
jgi:hypothetical protein